MITTHQQICATLDEMTPREVDRARALSGYDCHIRFITLTIRLINNKTR